MTTETEQELEQAIALLNKANELMEFLFNTKGEDNA